jgi:hypothetical protein
MKKITNSESYDIVFCKLCNRDAKLPGNLGGFKACTKCGGFGLIMKEKLSSRKNRRYTLQRKDLPAHIRIQEKEYRKY